MLAWTWLLLLLRSCSSAAASNPEKMLFEDPCSNENENGIAVSLSRQSGIGDLCSEAKSMQSHVNEGMFSRQRKMWIQVKVNRIPREGQRLQWFQQISRTKREGKFCSQVLFHSISSITCGSSSSACGLCCLLSRSVAAGSEKSGRTQ